MNKIQVLDHGFVRLVDAMGNDLSIVRSARVSYDAAWRTGENEGSDKKLLKYLYNNNHSTPFEAVTFTFEVKAPIFVIRQWHRHRTWTYNELSGRYRELPEEFYVPDPENIGKQSVNNKQGRDLSLERDMLIPSIIDHHSRACFESYRTLLSHDVPRELARMILPLNTYTHMFATVNLLNLLKFLDLRCDSHAQYEIRVYADALKELVKNVVPETIALWEARNENRN